ncbi:helix-turn-helix transcriptional regulator [Mesorhizobium sp. M1233]|uniref:helix-turn-helix domain-containing protein n=1 Tax=Mesorhizobium sp. M1233 TaxID=2957072 RepID=UPI00333692D3
MNEIPTLVLRTARENAGFTQSSLAPRLGITPSVVSRMEKAEYTDRTVAWRYLDAIANQESERIKEFYNRQWTQSERPSFLHPDRDALWEIEGSLQTLIEFESKPDFDSILARPLNSLRTRLLSTAQYLMRTDHTIAWVGQIGFGKTTALSYATGLTLTSEKGRQSVFPTGSGRMTLCEVVIKVAPAFGLAVDCLSVDEVRNLVSDLVVGLAKREAGIPTEMDRVLRSMAGIHREAVVDNGKKRFVDPLKVMLDSGDQVEDVINRVMLKLNLEARTSDTIILSEDKEGGLEWLAANVAKINSGQHPDFGVPNRITVLLPSKVLSSSPYDISILDTKGIEGTTQRPDLRERIDDIRTLTVLCSRFNDAPSEKPMSLLREVHDTRSDAVERERLSIVILPWLDEAMSVRGDDGATPLTIEDGYMIREDQARDALAREGLPEVPIYFYNALQESPAGIWKNLNDQIGRLRGRYHHRAHQLSAGASALVNDAHAAASLEARRQIADAVDRFVARKAELPMSVQSAHQNLIEQTRMGTASSIAASMNRRGGWSQFSVHHLLGVGVRSDAAARSLRAFVGIDEIIGDLEVQFAHLPDVTQALAGLRDEMKEWEQEFLAQALALGRAAFKPQLDEANELWRACVERWGQGAGYRDNIASILEDWFRTNENLDSARRSVESGLNQIWKELVLDALIAATRIDDVDGGEDTA